MRKLLFLAALSAASACAQKAGSPSGFDATCDYTANATIAGTSGAYGYQNIKFAGAPNGVGAVCGVVYNTVTGSTLDFYYPVGVGNVMPTIPDVFGCAWGATPCTGATFPSGTTTEAPIEFVQRTGYSFMLIETAHGNTNPLPKPSQDVRCAMLWAGNNLGTSSFPGNPNDLRRFGQSSGAHLTLRDILDSSISGNCSQSVAAYTNTRAAFLSTPPCLANASACPPGSGTMYSAGSALSQTAINGILNCTTAPTCSTADNTLQGSPGWFAVSGNLATLKSMPMWFGFGAGIANGYVGWTDAGQAYCVSNPTLCDQDVPPSVDELPFLAQVSALGVNYQMNAMPSKHVGNYGSGFLIGPSAAEYVAEFLTQQPTASNGAF